MPIYAVGSGSIASRQSIAAQDVFTVGYGFKMGRVNAAPVATCVVQNQAWRYLPYVGFVRQPVDLDIFSTPLNSGVAVWIDLVNPHPAAGF